VDTLPTRISVGVIPVWLSKALAGIVDPRLLPEVEVEDDEVVEVQATVVELNSTTIASAPRRLGTITESPLLKSPLDGSGIAGLRAAQARWWLQDSRNA